MVASVTKSYVDSLPDIYKHILAAFPDVEPSRKAGYGLAYWTLYERLQEQHYQHAFGEITQACEQMAKARAVEIKNKIFVHPTELGEQIIALLTGKRAAEEHVPPFPLPR